MDKKKKDMSRDLTDEEKRKLAVDTLNALETLLGNSLDSQRIYVSDVAEEISNHAPRVSVGAVMVVLAWLGIRTIHTAKGMRIATVSKEHIELAQAKMEMASVLNGRAARLIELYPRESLRVEVRRDAVEDKWYLLVTDSDQREVRVDEIDLGSVIYRAKS